MKRFKNILFAIKGGTRIKAPLRRAAALAVSNQAGLTIMDVLEPPPAETAGLLDDVSAAKLEDMLVAQRQAKLSKLASLVDTEGLQITTKVVIGIAFIEIIKEVLRSGHDLVMKAAEGKGGPETMLFGSTDLHLIRECPCPVWISKPTKNKRYRRILAAVDLDPTDEEKNKLNYLIMDLGSSLAERESGDLYVAHGWILYSEPFLKLLLGKSKVKELARQARKRHRQWLQELLKTYESVDTRGRVYLLQGRATELIPEMVRKKCIDLLVMGTVARTGLPEFLIGNTAEEVLNQVDCSVLTVKPEGFVSPIKLR